MSGRRWILTVLAAGMLIASASLTGAGCGGEASNTETAPAEPLAATAGTQPEDGTSTCACSGMPLVDETFVPHITEAATAAFDRQYGDGSGVYVAWGPNVVGDWAMIGLQNESGTNPGQALLHLELSGEWQVMGVGDDLAAEWQSQTPPELWPSA